MNRYVIGIDVGTTAVKLIVLNQRYEMVHEASLPHPLYTERAGWAEEDPALWWDHTRGLLAEAVAQLASAEGRSPNIEAIGVSGMVPAIVLLDENGSPLRRSIQQNDARCGEQIDELRAALDQESLFKRTGGRTNQQHVLPRLLWIKKHEPDIWRRIRHICGSYDWIVHCLTGQWSLEQNWAAESGLFDIRDRAWIQEYMKLYEIPQEWFPPVHNSSSIVGCVRPEVASELGLSTETIVVAGSADHVASAFSAGVVQEGDMLIKFGGAGDILFCCEKFVTHEKLFFDYHNIPGKYLLNGCMASSGSLVRWFVEQFLPQAAGENVFRDLDEQAEAVGPGSNGLVVLPYFLGEKTPIFDPKARGVFFGLSLHHTPAHLFRAILEAVIYGFRHHVEVLAERGLRPKRVFATNGGAKSKVWLQIAADILGLPLTSYKNHPGSSLGVAFLAGKAVGMFTEWKEIMECLPEQYFYSPRVEATAVYDITYGVYRRLYSALREEFHFITDYFGAQQTG
ncbi:MAG: FGGY-family carbohydrate kinase [Alicyclobacillus sp.]|nr:FGGY-family carbohydrate kinase [Alicyclobacillus sp.]